jgi:hypothetical protein
MSQAQGPCRHLRLWCVPGPPRLGGACTESATFLPSPLLSPLPSLLPSIAIALSCCGVGACVVYVHGVGYGVYGRGVVVAG